MWRCDLDYSNHLELAFSPDYITGYTYVVSMRYSLFYARLVVFKRSRQSENRPAPFFLVRNMRRCVYCKKKMTIIWKSIVLRKSRTDCGNVESLLGIASPVSVGATAPTSLIFERQVRGVEEICWLRLVASGELAIGTCSRSNGSSRRGLVWIGGRRPRAERPGYSAHRHGSRRRDPRLRGLARRRLLRSAQLRRELYGTLRSAHHMVTAVFVYM